MKLLAFITLAVAVALSTPAPAQTIPVTLTAAPTQSDGTAPITLTWSATGATACTASGGWSGSKATSGTQTLAPPFAQTQTFSISCTGTSAADGSAALSWTPPTQNTNGTPLTNISGYRVNYGTSASNLSQTQTVSNASAVSAVISNLASGTYFFTVTTLASTGVTSVPSNQASKLVTTSQPATGTASTTHVVNPVPAPPTNLTVRDVTAYEIRPNSTGTLVAARIGLIPLGSLCGAETRKVGSVTYNRVDPQTVDLVNWPTKSFEAWARCG